MTKKQRLRYTVVRPLIGGVPQAVLIPEDEPEKPLLLLVHGGPGEPMTPFSDDLGGLEARFVVCLWEQRGAGLSYAAAPSSERLHIAQYVSDAVEVTQYLLGHFGRPKLVLMGFSWGTLVGILAAAKAPELYTAYIGVGQIADQRVSERAAYEAALACALRAGDTKSSEFMIAAGPPPYDGSDAMKSMMRERTILRKYSGNPAADISFPEYFRKIFACPYYRLRDKINFIRGMQGGSALFKEVLDARVADAVRKLDVPFYILQGAHDMQTRPACARGLFDAVEAPQKRFVLFEDAGHSPLQDTPRQFLEALDSLELHRTF